LGSYFSLIFFFEKFFAVYAEYQSWTTKNNTSALFLVYSVKRAPWAPSLHASCFPFKGEQGCYIVIFPRIGMSCHYTAMPAAAEGLILCMK